MKKLEFDLIQWHEAYKKIPKGLTSLQMRNLKKDYFKGDAFNTAFPLALIEMPQRWIFGRRGRNRGRQRVRIQLAT